MNISEYAKRLGIEPKSPTVAPLDIEAGKAGYTQYLADIESFKKAQEETQASVEASKSWWDKASDFILRANGMSSQMSDNPIASGFNATVEAYKNIPEDNKPSDDWTDEERWAFGEKYSKDKNDAYSFAKQLNNDKANAKKAKQSEKISKWATRNGVNRTLASIGSLGINAAYGGLGFYDALAQKAAGRDTFVNHGVLLPHEATNAMQGAIADYKNKKWGTLNENIPIIGGKGVGDAYQLRQSILQSFLSGGGEGALFQFFGMAASQGVSDALSRGATSDQALAMGVVSGLAEAIPEMISVDKFVGMASAEGVQNLFKNILKQAGQEAGEEFTTSVINELADAWIMGGKSNYNQTVNALIASGMSPEQAKNRALVQTLEDLAYDVLSGAISGGVSGAGATGINRVNQQFFQTEANAKAKEALTPEQNKLIEEGKKYDTTKKRAEALEKKLADGKELSGYDLRMLANQVSEASRNADVDTLRKAIVEKMKAEGIEDGQAKRLGEIALNKAIGNEISKVQELMLKRNPAATKVYSQMSEEMMQSGLGDSEWVKNTPIEKLRAQNKASMSERDTEQRVQSGIERLKADIAATYGVDTTEYKINMESIEGKFGEIENKIVYKPSENSKIHVDGISSSLTQDDIIELSAIEKIANELGIDIHVYETKTDKKTGERVYTDKNGKRYSDSGFYDPSDNSIHIDLRAGENGEGTMLYTASHEVVHFIKENAAEHYAALEELVTKELVKGGYSIDTLIEERRKLLRKNGWDGTEIDFEAVAREEMVAEACQSFLASKNAVAEIKALKTKNKGLWTALKKFFTSLFTKISNVYKSVPPDSAQGKYIADMRKAVKPIRDAFMEGAVEAAKKNAASGSKTVTKTAEKKAARSQARAVSEIKEEMSSTDITIGENVADFINEVNSMLDASKRAKRKKKIGVLSQKHAALINSLMQKINPEFSAEGYELWIDGTSANHIEMRHGANGKKDHTMATKEAKSLIPWVAQNADGAEFITDKDGNISRSDRFFDSNGKRSPEIRLQKATETGIVFVSECVPDSANKRVWITSAYANKKGSKGQLLNMEEKTSPQPTPKASFDSIATTINISQPAEKVNDKSKILSKSRSTVTAEQDSAYLDAVKRGDTETAQKMVEEAAKANGYTEKVFHGTRSGDFYVFDEERIGDNYGGYNAEGGAFDFTYDESRAWLWAGKAKGQGKTRVIKAFIKAEKPFYSYDGAVAKELFDLLPKNISEDEKKYAMSYGVPFKEVLEQHGIDFKKAITSKGFDSYKMYRGDLGNIGVYSPYQIKSADPVTYDDNGDIIPLSERFNENSKDIRHKSRSYTAGQVAKMKADLSNEKVYSKSEVMRMIKRISPDLRNRSFEALADKIWQGLNTHSDREEKQAFAHDVAQMFVDRMIIDAGEADNKNAEKKYLEWEDANKKLAYLRPAIDSIGFRQKEIEDIKALLYTKGYEYLRKRWGYKYQKGVKKQYYPLDKFIADLANEMPGMEHLKDLSIAEAIIEVDKLYSALTAQVTQLYKRTYKKAPDEFIANMRNVIADEIMESFDELGTESKNAIELKEKFKRYEERISFWIAENVKTQSTARWSGIISTKALQLRDLKKGAFFNASQYRSTDTFKESIEQLTKVQWRGNISEQGVRKVFANLRQWYSMENPMLYDSKNPDADHLYGDKIALYLDLVGDTEKVEKEVPIEPDEYPMIYEVMNHLYTMMKNYGKIFRAGRWVDAADIAKAYIGIIDENDKKRTVWTRAQSLYNRQFLEPMALAKQADNYNPNGFFTQTVQELRQASVAASIGEMKLRKEYDEFVNANQKYLMKAAKETVKYRGKDIPKLHLISLYMSMKRKQSREGLALNGFEYTMKTARWDSETVTEVPGYVPQSEKDNYELINRATEEQMRIIAENFTDTDRQYMAILEKLFNEKLRNMKIERDMERQGYTNALEGYYYPIIRGGIAKNVDTAKFTDVNRATNPSFNQSTQEHAKQYLKIISADAMVNRHIKDMCKYYYMSQAIENYNVLYNIDSDKDNPNRNKPMSIAERLKTSKVWEKDYDYFKKLVADIQGIRDNKYDSDGWRFIETLRGNYAKFALGLNAKVLFTQVSSVIAAGDVIGFGSILSVNKNVGFVATKEDIEKYCPIADVRSYEQTVLKAMTLSDKMGKISEKLMIGISAMDDLVVRRLFAACQVEAKKRGEGEIGSEENKIAAGKILEQIILETQQNSYATEKSSAMRSANPVWRGLTMFTADGMKIISRIHEAVGELKTAKNNGNTAGIKRARKKVARSIAVAASISVYLAAISALFNWIYDRDEEDKDDPIGKKLLRFSGDVLGNFIGALPFISDLYDVIVNGFEVEDVALDTFNNVYGAINSLYKDATDFIDGKDDRSIEDLNRDLRSMLYAIGQLTGMPVRNVYNLARGIVGNMSPKAAYYIDSKFNETSLVNDLKKSIKQGDENKTSYIMSLIYDERLDERVSKEQSKEIMRLYEKISKKEIEGYTVIPKDIPDKIKRDGVEIELSGEQKEKIASEYSKVISAIDKLISSAFYKTLSDRDKAYMIDYYHDKYYETAVNNALKIKDEKVSVYNAIGFSTYAKFAYFTRGIESDKDKNGNTVAGSKKAKVVAAIEKVSADENKKLLYLASLGYSLSEAQQKKLCKYLNSLSISVNKKKSLAAACNFTYKNGKIYP